MRKNLIIYLVFAIIYLHLPIKCLANESNNIKFSAEKVDKSYLVGEVDKMVLKKYFAVKLDILNKNNKEIAIPDNVYYFYKDNIYKTHSSKMIYDKSKRHTIVRGIITFPFLILFVTSPVFVGTITYSITANNNLEDNIKKNNFKPKHVFEDDDYSAYIFIPKKHKKLSEIIIKNVTLEEQKFDIKTPVMESL
jgi:hypothetical protein